KRAAMRTVDPESHESFRSYARPQTTVHRVPARANTTIWVSRLITRVPRDARARQVAVHRNVLPKSTNELRRSLLDRKHSGYGFPVFGDDDPVRAQAIEDRETVLLELGGGDLPHTSTVHLVTIFVHLRTEAEGNPCHACIESRGGLPRRAPIADVAHSPRGAR